MMVEKIPFGEGCLSFRFPLDWEKETLLPNPSPALEDPYPAIEKALESPIFSRPLRDLVKPGQKITITVSDITRLWVQTSLFLPSILGVLEQQGVRDSDILLVVATGSHRDNTAEEIRRIVGDAVARRFRVLNHPAREKDKLTHLGRTVRGTDVWVNRHVAEADLVMVTGGVSFHSLAGFSGGCKGLLPGVSGYDTIQQNHRLALKDGGGVLETVKKGNLEKNPVAEDMLEAARMIRNAFLFNVVTNEAGKIVQAVAGDIEKAHLKGCKTVKSMSSVPLGEKGDVVLAAPGGFPWDISLYQSIKTLENASYAAKEGATIILVSESSEGMGPSDWSQWFGLGKEKEIEAELRRAFTIPGFIALKTASLTRRFRVILVSHVNAEDAEKVGMVPAPSVEEAIRMARETASKGRKAVFLPHGSFVLPIH